MIALAIVGVVCVAGLGALVLILRHLAAMRSTDSEIAALQEMEHNRTNMTSQALGAIRLRLDDHETRLTHLNNRTR